MKYSLFLFTLLLLPSFAHALVYDEVNVIKDDTYVTRLNFESTTYFRCTKTCKKVDTLPQPESQSSYALLSGFGKDLPPVVRALKTENNKFVAAFRSDGKNRVIQIVDLVSRKSYLRTEIITNEILLEETRLLSWNNHELFYLSDIDNRRAVYKVNADLLSTSGFAVAKVAGGNFEVTDFLPVGDKLFYVANPTDPYIWKLFEVHNNTQKEIDTDVSNIAGLVTLKDQLFYSKMTSVGFESFMYDLKKKKTIKLPMPKVKVRASSDLSYETKVLGNLKGTLVKHVEQKSKNSNENLIVWLHGGPHRQASRVLNPIRSYGTYDFTLAKIAGETNSLLLKIDYPGSIGHGKELANSIYQNVGGADVRELATSIEAAKKEFNIKNVYIGGTSYGGYLGLKFVAERPDLVTGVFAINPVTDWKFLFDTVNGSPLIKLFGNKKETVPQYLWDQADIYKKIEQLDPKKKIIIAYGDRDDNVPIGQSMTMSYFLKLKGKNIKELIFKDEGHTIVKKRSVQTFCLEFLKLMGSKSKKCEL